MDDVDEKENHSSVEDLDSLEASEEQEFKQEDDIKDLDEEEESLADFNFDEELVVGESE